MATTLWRLRRQAPAEASLIDIQFQRMTCDEVEFTSLNAHGAYAVVLASGSLGRRVRATPYPKSPVKADACCLSINNCVRKS